MTVFKRLQPQGAATSSLKQAVVLLVAGVLVVAGLATRSAPAHASDCDAVANEPFISGGLAKVVAGNGGIFCPDASATTISTSLTMLGAPFGEMIGRGTKNAFATAMSPCPANEATWQTLAVGAGVSPDHQDNDSATSAGSEFDCTIPIEPPQP